MTIRRTTQITGFFILRKCLFNSNSTYIRLDGIFTQVHLWWAMRRKCTRISSYSERGCSHYCPLPPSHPQPSPCDAVYVLQMSSQRQVKHHKDYRLALFNKKEYLKEACYTLLAPYHFCCWYPDSWALESGIQLKESGILLVTDSGIQILTENLESST